MTSRSRSARNVVSKTTAAAAVASNTNQAKIAAVAAKGEQPTQFNNLKRINGAQMTRSVSLLDAAVLNLDKILATNQQQ